MGTNFYKKIPLAKRDKEALKEAVEKEEFEVDEYGVIKFDNLDLKPNYIHIGKRSGGWKFLFDFNNWKYFGKTEKSLLNWIYDDSDDSIIIDEYGEVYTREAFMKEVDETYTPWNNGAERWDDTSYRREHPKENYSYDRGPLDMYIGKYRVSTFTNFS